MWAESMDASGMRLEDCASICHSHHRMSSVRAAGN